jgi:hypothetical protein
MVLGSIHIDNIVTNKNDKVDLYCPISIHVLCVVYASKRASKYVYMYMIVELHCTWQQHIGTDFECY